MGNRVLSTVMHAEVAGANVTPIVQHCISARRPSSEPLTWGRQGHDYAHRRVGMARGRSAHTHKGTQWHMWTPKIGLIWFSFCCHAFIYNVFQLSFDVTCFLQPCTGNKCWIDLSTFISLKFRFNYLNDWLKITKNQPIYTHSHCNWIKFLLVR